jgi:hypothetical protein
MHLITAALLAALFGKKQGADHHGLPSFAGVMEVVHALPGRLRLRAPVLIGQRRAAEQLQKSLAGLDGMRAAAVSPVTGTLLLHYAEDRVRPDMLMAAAIRLLGLERQIRHTPPCALGEAVREAGDSLNHAIHARTGGVLDLWTSVTLLLVVGGVRQLAAGNAFGWPLLWWAYRSTFPPERSRE